MTEQEIAKLIQDLAAKFTAENIPFLIIAGVQGTAESICASNAVHNEKERAHLHRVIDRFRIQHPVHSRKDPLS